MSAAKVPAHIQRLREAVLEAGQSRVGGAAYWRQVAVAKRALAVAYQEAARLAPHDSLLRAAMSDAASNLERAAHYAEECAVEIERDRRLAASGGQA